MEGYRGGEGRDQEENIDEQRERETKELMNRMEEIE